MPQDPNNAVKSRAGPLPRCCTSEQPVQQDADRLARLQAVTAALSVSLTPAQVADVVVEQGVAALGARAGSIALLTEDGSELELIRTIGYSPEQAEPWRRFRADAQVPISDAVRTGEPIWLESPKDWSALYPHLAANRLRRADDAWAAIPLIVEGGAIGGMGLTFPTARTFSEPDRAFMLALARQCAQALKRARLYEEAHSARSEAEAAQRRFAFLAEASAVLGASLDYNATLVTMARLAVPFLADWCLVDMVGADGVFHRLAVTHIDPVKEDLARAVMQRHYKRDRNAPHGVAKVVRTGQPEYMPEVTEDVLKSIACDADHLQILREVGMGAYLCAPLVVRERTVGTITLTTSRDTGRHFSADDRLLAEELARRAALAVDNAWLYREAREEIAERERAEHVSRGQTAALARTLNALMARPELDAFLGQVLTAVAEQLASSFAAISFYDAAQDTLSLRWFYVRGHVLSLEQSGHPTASAPRLARNVPLWQEMVRTRQPVIVEDIETDPRLSVRDWLISYEMQTMVLVPLLIGEEAIGWIGISSTERRRYQPEEIALAQALAQQATLAVQLTRLAEQGRQNAVLAERNRMAREIHDTLAQGFTGIAIQLEAAEDTLTAEAAEAQAHIARARDLARVSLAEARRSMRALRPQALEQSNLPGALAALVTQMTSGSPIQAEFHVQGNPYSLPPEIEHNLLRVGLEALTNALRHAEATSIRLELSFEAAQIRLSVQDNGHGFTPPLPRGTDGFGLTCMRERAQSLGGQLTVSSGPGQGTEILVEMPAPSLSSPLPAP